MQRVGSLRLGDVDVTNADFTEAVIDKYQVGGCLYSCCIQSRASPCVMSSKSLNPKCLTCVDVTSYLGRVLLRLVSRIASADCFSLLISWFPKVAYKWDNLY
jgi:hypothetical protein